MKIFTYYAPVANMSGFTQRRMIDIWSDAWSRAGWEPVVLSPADARNHPDHDALHRKFSSMPTVNHKDYELACFMRWVAMGTVGGVMTDYDVLPFGFMPSDVPKNSGPFVSILADNNPCPCAVSGTSEQFAATTRLMADYVIKDSDRHGDRPHVSDQSVVQAIQAVLRPHIHDLCPEYRSRHWQAAPMVHYCHAATNGHDRLALMRAGLEGRRE